MEKKSTFLPYRVKNHHSILEMDTFKVMLYFYCVFIKYLFLLQVTEGLCKLMLSKVITSAKLFTRLILMWYNPVTESHGKLRHILGAFFPLYGSLSHDNQTSIEESFMPTLKTLFSAPGKNPLILKSLFDLTEHYYVTILLEIFFNIVK